MTSEAKRESVHRKVDLFLQQLRNGNGEALRQYFYDIVDTLLDETQTLQQHKAEASDLRELVIEMRAGFKRMDERFADLLRSMEARFEQVDKRFQQVDKRFEQVDKRFEQVDKRFEQVDKRFEQVDARFNRIYQFLMWMLGVISAGFVGLYLKLFFVH